MDELFAAQAASNRQATALVFQQRQVSYGELNSRADRLASHLRGLGVGPEALVGVYCERGIEMIVAILGVLKAGAAYVPLDIRYPSDRLGFMIADAGLTVLLTLRELAGGMPAAIDHVISLDNESDWEPPDSESPREHPSRNPDNLAYAIYTSGSTGRPKGVLIQHSSLSNLVLNQQRELAIGPGSRVLQLASTSFDVSVWEIFTALTSGATLCVARADELVPGPALIETLRRLKITVAAFAASTLAALPAANLPDLRTMVVGGERCSADLVARWSPGRQMINHYGPTEATVCATMHRCTADGRDPPIGRPIDNVRVASLNDQGQPVKPGDVGELYIGGAGLARGYLNRPELTAQRFIVDTPNEATEGRMYRTGDLVRLRDDAAFEFVGRVDEQIKLRGYRIELGEIESVLRIQAGVDQAVVILREDVPGAKRLVAYVVGTRDLKPSALRSRLEEQLPAYMLPSAIVQLDALPLTANGKADRTRLPPPEKLRPQAEQETSSNPIEQTLTAIWCEVLFVESVGRDEHFVEAGGDSLSSVEIALRASKAGIALKPQHLFAHPTIAKLAQFAESRG